MATPKGKTRHEHSSGGAVIAFREGIPFVAMIATALQRGLVQQDEHWGHAILRPVGVGLAGLGVIEVCKLAASAMLSGSLSL